MAELNVSELKTNTEKKRKEVGFLTQVTMESEKDEAPIEPVVSKRKRMTGHSFKARFKGMRRKEVVGEKLSVNQSEKLPSYQGTEEQVHSVNPEKQYLKVACLQDSQNSIHSGRDHLLTEADINQETSKVDEERLRPSALKLVDVKMNIEKDSAKEGDYENQILLQQNQAVKNKGAENEIDSLINKIQKNCDKRMNKLIWKQIEQIQEFNRIWEEKRSNLERDQKLDLAVIQSMHGEDSARMVDKLKLLDVTFAKKMEEFSLLKDKQLKALEAEQLAAHNEEREKEARWLAEANAWRYNEPRAVYGPHSLVSQSEEVGKCSQSSTHIRGTKDEDSNPSKSVQGNNVALSEKSVSTPAEEVSCNPVRNSSNFVDTDPQNEVVQLNQPKCFGTPEIVYGLPASRESIPSEIQAVEPNKEVPPEVPETVPNEIVELSENNSNKGIDEGDDIGLPNALVNQEDETDETTTGGLPLVGQILEPSEQTKASPHHCALLLPQVSEDQIHQASIQDQGAQVVEEQNTSLFEVTALEHVDSVSILQSNIELPDQDAPAIESQMTLQIEIATSETDTVTPNDSSEKLQDRDPPAIESQMTPQIAIATLESDAVTPDESSEKLQDQDAPVVEDQVALQIEVVNSGPVDTVNPVQSNVDEPSIENGEDLHLKSIDVPPSSNQPPSIEVESQSHNPERKSSPTTEIAETGVVPHESASPSGENRELQSNHLDIGCESQVAHGRNVELSTASQSNVAMSQMEVSTVELPHQAGLQLGSVGHRYGSSYLLSDPNHQVALWNSPPLLAVPLQNELERISKETEQLQKSHEDKMAQLRSDREKKIQEIVAEIRKKYELKLQDAEAELSLKKNGLDENSNKVLKNKLLAEAFRLLSFDHPGMLQGIPSSSMQHPVRPPPVATACQPIAGPNLQDMHQILLPHFIRHNPLSLGCTSRPPPVITAITPTGNPRFGGEIRCLAPHLQPALRPGPASSMPAANCSSIARHPEQLLPSRPLQSPQPPPVPQQPMTSSQGRPQLEVEPPAQLNPSLSALEFLMDVDDRVHIPRNRTFGSLEQSILARLRGKHGNQTSSGVPTDAICLSDDN